MAYKAKAYTLREESTESGIRYFISFKDGQGEHHELEVSEQLFFEFRQMERRNRNLLQWDERHREFSEVWDETLNRRALKLPKSIEEQMIEAERAELLCKAVDGLPEIQRRRFLLYYEYEFNFDRHRPKKKSVFYLCGIGGITYSHFFRGSKSIFKEVNAYVQQKQDNCPKGGNPCRSYRQSTPKRSFMSRLRSRPLWWTALSPQACRCSAAHRR